MLVVIFSTFENSKLDLESKFDQLVDFFYYENMMLLLDLKSRNSNFVVFIGGPTLESHAKTECQTDTLKSLCDWLALYNSIFDWLRASSSKHQFEIIQKKTHGSECIYLRSIGILNKTFTYSTVSRSSNLLFDLYHHLSVQLPGPSEFMIHKKIAMSYLGRLYSRQTQCQRRYYQLMG